MTSLWLAFAAGLLSFFSPCILPLVPGYLAFLTSDAQHSQNTLHGGVLFILGFSIVFILLGSSASLLGAFLQTHLPFFQTLSGLLVILFGLFLLGFIPIQKLYQDVRLIHRFKPSPQTNRVLMGMAFAFGWTPCVGPLLGSILAVAGNTQTFYQGTLLLVFYSAGLAIPFLALAVLTQRFLKLLQKIRPLTLWIEKISGLLLIMLGILIAKGWLSFLGSALLVKP
jgi:cytochrome c-type biogenesis protein